MILKRMLAVALGALGLGALASGPAFGQAPGSSNIPAPNVFDDQITCTQLLPSVMGNNLPSTVPMGGMTSPLDDIIGMGTNLLEAGDTVFDAVTDAPAKLAGLGYVIPADNMNCGAGTTGPMLGTMNIDADTNGSFLDAGDTIAWGSIPEDVADGYSELLTKFVAVYGNPGGTTGGTLRALEAAQKLVDGTDTSLEALLEARVRARDAAQEAHNKALASFNAASRGPIYQAGVTEWKAKAAVTKGIDDYNKQVTKTNEVKTALDAMQYSNWEVGDEAANFAVTQGTSKYVPLTNTSLVGTVVTIDAMGMGTLGALTALETYTGGTSAAPVAGTAAMAATGVGTADAMAATSSDSSTSNFTTLGELIVPMTASDLDDDGASFLEALVPTVTATNAAGTNDIATIRTTVENVRIAAATLKKARDENTNPRFQDLYDEAYRRANLEQEYYDALWSRVLADNTDTRNAQQRLQYVDTNTNGINEASEQTTANLNNDSNSAAVAANYYVANPVTIASRNAAYSTESANRMNEELSLRGLVAAREAATKGVVGQFTDAQSFYQQLVDRRTALKAAADKAVADATNPSAAQTKAAADAAKALMAAQDEKTKIDALFPAGDDNPVVGLVSELLKTGGDDGQALVDAISDTYDGTQANKGAIDALKGQLTDAEGNPIDLTNLGDSEAVTQNTSDIETLDGRVTTNETDLDRAWMDIYGTERGVEAQHEDLAACDAAGIANVANCANARSIHNADRLDDVDSDIEGLDGRVGDNEDDIATNAENIKTNTADIATNAENIKTNTDNIATNAEGIMTNAGNISMNAEDIMTNSGNIAMNAEDIMTNSGNIAMNAEDIMTNTGNISMNAEDIMTNAGNIATNAEGIMTNAGDISMNAEGIMANAGNISSNNGRIGANAMAISGLDTRVGANTADINGLQDQMEVVRAGVAASMALAGMPAVNGRGIAIGVGSFDGESAFAVGFQIQGEQASFKVGVTSSGGATGASAGVGFNF